MPEPFPPQTWPEGATPTVDQLKVWIQTFEDHHDARIAADMIAGMLGAVQEAYARTWGDWQREADQRRRYRLAWLSARARARGTRNAALRFARETSALGYDPDVAAHLRGGV